MKKLLKTGKPRKTKKNSITFEINKKKMNEVLNIVSVELLSKDCQNYI